MCTPGRNVFEDLSSGKDVEKNTEGNQPVGNYKTRLSVNEICSSKHIMENYWAIQIHGIVFMTTPSFIDRHRLQQLAELGEGFTLESSFDKFHSKILSRLHVKHKLFV